MNLRSCLIIIFPLAVGLFSCNNENEKTISGPFRKPVADATRNSTHPNIVLIVADDHGTDDLGCYGNSAISTPNLDYLASEGVRFTNAYATAPSCTASRSVILTGLYNHLNGLYGHAHSYHHFKAHEFLKSLPIYLEEEAGYRTARIGKYHVAPPEVFRFQEVLKSPARNDVAMADSAGAFIQRTDEPFFLYFCTHDPHRSGNVVEDDPLKPNRFGNPEKPFPGVLPYTIDPSEVIVPYFLPDLPETRAELAQYYKSVNRVDQGVGRLIEHLKKNNKWENTFIVYISDNGIAFQGAKTNIYEPGIKLPCLVKNVNSRNKGMVTDAIINWSDLTPTILDVAGTLPQATDTLIASFQEYSKSNGLQTPVTGFHGKSFLPVLEGEVETVRKSNFASQTFHEITMYYPMRSVISGDYKLIWNIASELPFPHASDLWASATWQAALHSESGQYGNKTVESYTHRPEFQLYNLKEDPDESHNLAYEHKYYETLYAMKEKLKQFQVGTNDPWVVKWDHE